MSARARFATLSVLFSACGYALALVASRVWPAVGGVAFDSAFIGAILAAQGASFRRRFLFAGGMVAAVVALLLVVAHTSAVDAADVMTTRGARFATDYQLVTYAMAEAMLHGIPLAVLAVFVGRRPSVLWSERRSARDRSPTRA